MKNGKSFFSKFGIVAMWMASFVVLIIFSVFFMLLGYRSVEKNMNKQMEQMNETFMEERIQYIDRYISNIASGLLNITRLSEFEILPSIGAMDDNEKRFFVMNFSKSMDFVEIGDVMPELRFVYIPDDDIVIGSGIIRDCKSYFESRNFKGTYEQWQDNVLDKTSDNMLYYDRENELLYFKTWYQPNEKASGEVMVAIAITKNDFAESFRAESGIDFVISGTDDRQILSATGKDYSELINDIEFLSKISVRFLDEQVISYQKGIGVDWNYMCVYDSRAYVQTLMLARIIIICCTAVVVVLGVLMSYYFTKKNNRFIFKLSGILNMHKRENEYVAIYEAVNEIIKDANKSSRILYMQGKKKHNELLRTLLLDKELPAGFERELQQEKLTFAHEYFCVAEIETAQYFNIFFEENPDTEEALQLAKYIIANVYQDFFNEIIKVYPTEVGKTGVVLLINCAGCAEEDKAKIKQVLNFGAAFIEENFNISLLITVSKIAQGIENISKCYESILWAKYYRTMNYDGILDCDELEKKQDLTYCYYYSSNDEQLLIADIKRGDYDRILIDIEKIFEFNVKKNTAPKFMKILAFNIVDLLIRAVNPTEAEGFSETVNSVYTKIEDFESVPAMKEQICVLAQYVCGLVNNDEQQYIRRIIEEIKNYIDESYTNPILNANYIADWFNMKPSFLSTLFKKQEGMGLLEYIAIRRVNAAKELLRKTDYTMPVICEKAGFTSERTFFRVFEKYVGMSPGKFKREQAYDDNKPDRT